MSLQSKTVKQLKDMARGKVKGFSKMKKAELVAALGGGSSEAKPRKRKIIKKVVAPAQPAAPKKPKKKIIKKVVARAPSKPKATSQEKVIVFGREFERRPIINNTANLRGIFFETHKEMKEYKRVLEGGKPKTKNQAPAELKKIYQQKEEDEKESKVPTFIKNWNKDVNNIELEQTKKRLTDTIKGLVNSKKKNINLDSVITFDLPLTKDLMQKYNFQKVLDGYKRFVEYLDDGEEKTIGKDKVKDFYFIRDGRTMPNAMMKKLPQKFQKIILEEWKKLK